MTLADIISDYLTTEGLDEIVEQAAELVVEEVMDSRSARDMMADLARAAMREKKRDIEDAILDQLQETVEDAVADFVS